MGSIRSAFATFLLVGSSTLAPASFAQAQATDPSDISTLRISEEESRGIVWDDQRKATARPRALRILSGAPTEPAVPVEPAPPDVEAQ
jgi:hypothetical protein